MEDLLRVWDLEVLLPRLAGCGVFDTEALLLIKPEHSKRIFQEDELGLELKFFSKLKEYRSTLEQPVSPIVWAVCGSSESVTFEVDPGIAGRSSLAAPAVASNSKRLSGSFEDEQ
ncbi:uncharacterized protein LOC127750101 [Frankliniella occidentalis]|uniref:Uncharacterized protein LOC127750101 n=1 Tax=Frankliniella occidentalis TaxID=133901 RepID=A0A9C6X0T1_FRAOC|nr:uncharacterized protein LOC127750101 [Frankliniella occidentalis]